MNRALGALIIPLSRPKHLANPGRHLWIQYRWDQLYQNLGLGVRKVGGNGRGGAVLKRPGRFERLFFRVPVPSERRDFEKESKYCGVRRITRILKLVALSP